MNDINQFYSDLRNSVSKAQTAAYTYQGKSVNYPEFIKLAECMHSKFSDCHKKPIITMLNKDIKSYAAILAIVLSGNTWVPLSTSSPPHRNAAIIKNFNNAILITDEELDEKSYEIRNNKNIRVVNINTLVNCDKKVPFTETNFDPDSNAMIYFTSGSTGEPKGVRITHRNYISVIKNIMKLVPWPVNGVYADYHDLSFVISIPILFSCWLTQSAISPALAPEEIFLPIDNLKENKVNVLITVPSTIARIKQVRPNGIEGINLDVIINCGEPLHLDILDYSLQLAQNGKVFNFYGSTEVAPWTFYHHCKKGDSERFKSIGYAPIGTLLPGIIMAIDKKTSELKITGPQITPGYLFADNSKQFIMENEERWYKTGDKVIEFEGLYICKGRLDSQIKLNGYRIELMDVEAHLRTIPNVNSAVCFVSNKNKNRPIFITVINAKKAVGLAEVRDHLKNKLPSYMIPRKVYNMQKIPLNKSGKIDRLAVKAMFEKK